MLNKIQSNKDTGRDIQFVPFFYWYKKFFFNKKDIKTMSDLMYLAEFGKISGGLFHDILSPITAIKIYLDSLSQKEKVCDQLLDKITTSSNQLEDLLIRIKKYSQEKEIWKSFSIHEEVQNIIGLLGYQIIKNNISLICKQNDDITFFANPLKFQQVIMNLVLNAVDSYKEHDIDHEQNRKIIIDIFKKDTYVNILVRDFGCGISERKIKYIFDPFYTTKESGNGIGLATVSHIIETEFHGKIEVKSEPQKGSSFLIKLPVNNLPHRN